MECVLGEEGVSALQKAADDRNSLEPVKEEA